MAFILRSSWMTMRNSRILPHVYYKRAEMALYKTWPTFYFSAHLSTAFRGHTTRAPHYDVRADAFKPIASRTLTWQPSRACTESSCIHAPKALYLDVIIDRLVHVGMMGCIISPWVHSSYTTGVYLALTTGIKGIKGALRRP